MAQQQSNKEVFTQEDHQAAYIFDPDEVENGQQRSNKRRRVSKQSKRPSSAVDSPEASVFSPLLGGAEGQKLVHLRHELFQQSWQKIESRIDAALRDSNSAVLDQVASFVGEASSKSFDKIPTALIITGSNIASQNLLFEQLSESLQETTRSRFVRLRSSEATNLKVTLKKIIHDVVSRVSTDDEDDGHDPLKGYLDYDLEALHAYLKTHDCEHVFVAFEDSEGFDSALFFDLIPLLNSWRPHIPFTLLFGIATSVELLQARLSKSVSQQIYGAQFDAVQTESILETVFNIAVVSEDVPVRLGAPLPRGILERQRHDVAGIQAFVSSIKYAYMCHFYANALSPLPAMVASGQGTSQLQPEHIEAIRNLPSFRFLLESKVESEDPESLRHARSLLEDDGVLLAEVEAAQKLQQEWVRKALVALLVLEAAGASDGDFAASYLRVLAGGQVPSEHPKLFEAIRQMGAPTLSTFVRRTTAILRDGDGTLLLKPAEDHNGSSEALVSLSELLIELETLQRQATEEGLTLRSSYSGHIKVTRTTVIAQRVQLSRGTAALSEQDKHFTKIVDGVTGTLEKHLRVPPVGQVFLSESWTYDSAAPSRDVFLPRPRPVFERSLGRPHDYLGCECCKEGSGGIRATLPATAILYQLYLETGSLINVADLWTAFLGLVGAEEGEDERKVLVSFYQGLAELRALGFVKASKKKADHIAKLKWL